MKPRSLYEIKTKLLLGKGTHLSCANGRVFCTSDNWLSDCQQIIIHWVAIIKILDFFSLNITKNSLGSNFIKWFSRDYAL